MGREESVQCSMWGGWYCGRGGESRLCVHRGQRSFYTSPALIRSCLLFTLENCVAVVGAALLDHEFSACLSFLTCSSPNHCDELKAACWAARSRSYSQPGPRFPMRAMHAESRRQPDAAIISELKRGVPAPTNFMKLQAPENPSMQFPSL